MRVVVPETFIRFLQALLVAACCVSTTAAGSVNDNAGHDSRDSDSDPLIWLGLTKREIARQGLERIWLGFDGHQLFVRFENSVFNRNDLDAIGVVLGIVVDSAPADVGVIDITLSRFGIATFRFRGERREIERFYAGVTSSFIVEPALPSQRQAGDMVWLGGSRSPYLVPRLSFGPVLRNAIDSNASAFDYSLGLRAQLTLPIWSGAEIIAEYDVNIDDSQGFAPGQPYSRFRHDDGLKTLLLRQTMSLPFDLYGSIAVGRTQEVIFEDHDTVAVEGAWQSADGVHRMTLAGALLDRHSPADSQRKVLLAGYRLYSRQLDAAFEIEAGRFRREGSGVRVSVTRNFGDTRVKLFARSAAVQRYGIEITVPLTFRRDMRPEYWQVKAADQWSYEVSIREGVNSVRPPEQGSRPAHLDHLGRAYFNNDRLSTAYLRANMDRLRAAFQELVR